MEVNHDILRKQVMINQFCNQVGCSQDTATKILQASRWQIEVAFSLFFQDHGIVSSPNNNSSSLLDQQQSQQQQHYNGVNQTGQNCCTNIGPSPSASSRTSYSCVPANTPATPPSLPDTLAAFAQMKASSPDQRGMMEPHRIVHVHGQQFSEY